MGELVDAEYEPGRRLLGAYNFVGAPQAIEIGIHRRSPCFLPPAIVERAAMATTVSTDGKSQSSMRFLVRSQAQFVEIKLPADSTLWSTSIDGQPTKPRQEGESVLLSLPTKEGAVRDVQVVFESPIQGLHFWDKISLDAPRLSFHRTALGAGTEVPVADLQWDVFLPKGYEVGAASGSLVSHDIRPRISAAVRVANWLYDVCGGIDPRRGLVGGCVVTAGHLAASSKMGSNVDGYVTSEMVTDRPSPLMVQNSMTLNAVPQPGVAPRGGEADRRIEIINRMRSIKIPEIDFRQANIRDVIEFLKVASVEFDTHESGDEARGVNVILNLSAGQPAVSTQAPEDPFAPAASHADGSDVAPITFSARYISLYEALKIVTDVANLKFRIAGNHVMVLRRDAPEGALIHRRYDILPAMRAKIDEVSRELAQQNRRSGDFIEFSAASGSGGQTNWKKFFSELGVDWPAGSSLTYIPSMGKLIVANTPENLSVFKSVLGELNVGDFSGVGSSLKEREPEDPFSSGLTVEPKPVSWAVKGLSSLKIDLTRTGTRLTFQSLGTDPLLRLRLIHKRRIRALAWALAGLVFLVGLVLTPQRAGRKALYIMGVMVLTMAIPALPKWASLSVVMNHGFYAACSLVPYYLIAAFVLRLAVRSAASVLGRSALVMLFVSLSLWVSQGVAAEQTRGSDAQVVQIAPLPDPVSVPADAIVIPYRENGTTGTEPDRIMIPYPRFRKLWHLAYGQEEGTEKPPVPYAFAGAEYHVELRDGETLSIHGKLVIDAYGPSHAEVSLPMGGGVITSAKLDGQPAKLTSGYSRVGQVSTGASNTIAPSLVHGQQGAVGARNPPFQMDAQRGAAPSKAFIALYVPSKGRHILDITVDMKLTRRGGWRVVEGWVPVAPATALKLIVQEAKTDIVLGFVDDSRSYKTKKDRESIETALQADGRFNLKWRPNVSEGEADVTLTAESAVLFDVREDQLSLVWELHLMFRRGERDAFSVTVPGDYVVEKVEGENVRGWATSDKDDEAGSGSKRLKVDLLKRSEKEDRFTLHLWKPGPIAAGDGEHIRLPVVAAPEAMRHTGKVTIRRSPLMDVRTLEAPELRRIDLQTKDFPGVSVSAGDESPLGIRPYESYEFVAVPFNLKLEARPDRTEVDAQVNTIFRIAEDEHRLEARIDLITRNRPLHLVRVSLPSRFELEEVKTPVEFEWTVREGAVTNELTLYFAAGLQGNIPVVLRASSAVQQHESVGIPMLTVLSAGKQSGDIVIQADPAYDVRPQALSGLEAILMKRVHGWLAASQRPLSRLAFHYRKPGYAGKLLFERRKADVTCHTISNIRVTDKAIEETVLINFSIRNAGIRRVQFRMPLHLREARISAPLLRDKTVEASDDGKHVLVTLQLQDEVMDEFSVLVESDRLLSSDVQSVTVPVVLTGRTDHQYVTLENAGRDEIVEERVVGLEPLGRQQKEWARVAPLVGRAMTSAYIVRDNADVVRLAFRTKQRLAVETAGARIGLSRCVLILDEEGAYRGEQTYHVDNQTEQFLEITLPAGASLWTTVVAGELVKPVTGEPGNPHHIRIPLVKTAAGDLDYTVQLKYGGGLGAIRNLGQTRFPLLRTRNVNVALTQLELRLPHTRKWGAFEGSMRRVSQSGDFEAGMLSYQTKLAKRLVKTLQYGNVFEQARAVSNLKGVQQELQMYQHSLNVNLDNDMLSVEVSNAGMALEDAELELENVEGREEAQDQDGLSNREELNTWFGNQRNTLGRNKVLQAASNFGGGDVAAREDAKTQKVFNAAWLRANGLASAPPQEGVAKLGLRVQGFGNQGAKAGRGYAKAPAAYEQVTIKTSDAKPSLRYQAKRKGQKALASRYKDKLEKQQSERLQRGSQVVTVTGRMADPQSIVQEEERGSSRDFDGEDLAFGMRGAGGMGAIVVPTAGTGLASLDVSFPPFDTSRWVQYRFTTPLGEPRVTARSISESALEEIKQLGLAIVLFAAFFVARVLFVRVRRRKTKETDSGATHYLPTILILFGVLGLLIGILPVAATWMLILGCVAKVSRAIRRRVLGRA